MAIGAGSKGEEPITAINVTPLVDVCLVLVIIFMAVAPFAMTMGIKVLESRAKAAEGKASAEDNVTVKLDVSGQITVNGAAAPPDQLKPMIMTALQKSKDRMVIVTADDGNRVGQVVAILDLAKEAGALKLAILKSETVPAPGGKT
ncbi:MAG: biopolymer transporter ExbD [Elusimicrobia bacterium]|nr:biopolymer transporter ExbD [Elusimicrobiota bacterium]